MSEIPVINPDQIRLETERFILRPLKEEDSESIYENVKEYDIARWTINIPHPYPEDGAIKFIRETIESIKKGTDYHFAILLKDNLELVGVMGLMKVDNRNKNAELGYWIGRNYWNKGIATEAASRALDFGFKDLKLERTYAKCFHNNDASRRVLEKIGMDYEGKLRHEVFKENRFIDIIYFAVLKEDWLKNQ